MKMIRKLNSENKVIGLFQGTRVDSDNYQKAQKQELLQYVRYNVTILPVFVMGHINQFLFFGTLA